MLGIPPMLDIGFVDQSFPEPIDDIQGNTASFAPEHSRLLVASANAHTRLTLIMPKVMGFVKTFKKNIGSSPIDLENLIGKIRLVEIEQELQIWYQHLVSEVLPGGERTPQLERACQLLRIAHAYVQMVLYEPLVQCISRQNDAFIGSPMFDYLMKYSSATRRIVSTGISIHKSRVANYSSRSTMISTTYSAILSLIVFLLNVPASSNTKSVIFKETLEGREVLEELSSRSKLADEYIQKLNMIFERFQDGPRPFPLSVPNSPLAATDIEPGTAYPAPFFTGGSSVEPLSSQPPIAAPEQYDATWHPVSIPGNLVFESPLPLLYGYAFGDVNLAAPVIQPELMDTTFQTCQFDLLSATDLMELDYSLPGAQDTDLSQTVGRNLTTQGLPLPSTPNAVFPESSSLAPSIPYPETTLSHPISIWQPQGSTEPMPHMGWILPDVNDARCSFGTVEPMPEQFLGSILAAEMD
ncbi:Gypsy retrotransposon integrase-like protein 1 [Aspergillus melleus]|uniref:Gypsy retrotransposon integrase-like protein 1 n=1 Tax=Aspergillus melleus TaxID=138277 RepID=A0ACC3B610_9EURO|nr:Gypsy retrotransposon integrase-like protein 1 [Aspergillus melleus]